MRKYNIENFNFSISANETEAISNGVQGKKVTIPHTWNIDDEFVNHVGVAYYSTTIRIEKIALKTILYFHAVYRDCTVYLNGICVGVHYDSGYTPFKINITDSISEGDNLLVVKCDNSFSRKALPYAKCFDWTNDGGIIRNVELIQYDTNVAEYVAIQSTITDFLDNSLCNATINYKLKMVTNNVQSYKLRIIEWKTNKPIFEKQLDADCYSLTLQNAKLWNVNTPNLYILELDFGGTIVTQRFGIRKIETRGNKIFVNNKQVRFLAVEWMPGSNPDYGMAESNSEMAKFLEMLKDLNCNFTRFHWQQDDYVLDWCDEHGIMVQIEIPYWGSPKAATKQQLKVAKSQAGEMVHYHYNHPSIVCWGVGNEMNGWNVRLKNYVKNMVTYFKSLDNTRLVNYVSSTLKDSTFFTDLLNRKEATWYGDICMWNEYLGTWHKTVNIDKSFETGVKNAHDKPLIITEFGLCEPAFKGGDQRRIKVYQKNLELFRKYDLAGWVYFSLNDYRTHFGEDGKGKLKKRVHGSVDLVGNKKPSYDFIKAENSKDNLVNN